MENIAPPYFVKTPPEGRGDTYRGPEGDPPEGLKRRGVFIYYTLPLHLKIEYLKIRIINENVKYMGIKKGGKYFVIKLYIPTPLRVLRLKLLGSVLPHRPTCGVQVNVM